MKIYLIQRHEGSHDDYRVTSLKAYDNKKVAKELIKIYNKDIKIVLEKDKLFYEKQQEDFLNFENKFDVWSDLNENNDDSNYSKMLDSKEYISWSENNEKKYLKILALFKYEKFDYIDATIEYTIQEIEFIKGENKKI